LKILCRAYGAVLLFAVTHGDAVGYPVAAPPALKGRIAFSDEE
jgi:hypothetical protein